jgi:lipid A 3-O-deacylase
MREKIGSRLLAALPISLGPGTAWAQGVVSEITGGVLYHDARIVGEHKEGGADLNGELLFVSPIPKPWAAGIDPHFRWMLRPRFNIGFDGNASGYTSQLYFGLTWTANLFYDVFRLQDHVSFSIGFGPAFNNGHVFSASSKHLSLGSNVLFHPSLEVAYWFTPRYSASIYYEHSSNADLAKHNDGLNNLGIRLGRGF